MEQSHQISRLLEKDCMASITQDNESFDQFYQCHLDSVKERERQKTRQREENLRKHQQEVEPRREQPGIMTSSFFEAHDLNIRDSVKEVLTINESFINVTSNKGMHMLSSQHPVSPLGRSKKQKIN